MSSGSLSVLGDVYNQLAKQGRLFVPARAAREFAKNRNNELGNLIQNLKMRRERLSDLPPILANMPGYKEGVPMLFAELRDSTSCPINRRRKR